jgi:glycerol kinase
MAISMSASDWTMQFLADMRDAPVDRPEVLETAAGGGSRPPHNGMAAMRIVFRGAPAWWTA